MAKSGDAVGSSSVDRSFLPCGLYTTNQRVGPLPRPYEPNTAAEQDSLRAACSVAEYPMPKAIPDEYAESAAARSHDAVCAERKPCHT